VSESTFITSSIIVSPDSRSLIRNLEHESSAEQYINMSEILEFQKAQKFVPTLQEMDRTQSGRPGKGVQEAMAWFHGRRSFNGHPFLLWPAPDMVLKRFGSAHGWASKVSGMKDAKASISLLVNRFNTLLSISDFALRICPQQYRSFNKHPDYEKAMQHARDMDISRGSGTFNSWWDRIRVNRSCYESAIELQRILPLIPQYVPSLQSADLQLISKNVNSALSNAKGGCDKFGESHLREGRQKFKAADELKEVDDILKRACSSIKILKRNFNKARNAG
jgi:hypothetical protein